MSCLHNAVSQYICIKGYIYYYYYYALSYAHSFLLATQEKAHAYKDEEVRKAFTDINMRHAEMLGHSATDQVLAQVSLSYC